MRSSMNRRPPSCGTAPPTADWHRTVHPITRPPTKVSPVRTSVTGASPAEEVHGATAQPVNSEISCPPSMCVSRSTVSSWLSSMARGSLPQAKRMRPPVARRLPVPSRCSYPVCHRRPLPSGPKLTLGFTVARHSSRGDGHDCGTPRPEQERSISEATAHRARGPSHRQTRLCMAPPPELRIPASEATGTQKQSAPRVKELGKIGRYAKWLGCTSRRKAQMMRIVR